nr:carcinine transporter-like [Cherax quadricarinatus]
MLVMPLVIMGLVSTIGGMLTFRLPETLQQKLPNSMAEGESFGQDFTWRDCWACVPQKKKNYDLTNDFEDDREVEEIISVESLGGGRSSGGVLGGGRTIGGGCGGDGVSEATPLRRLGSRTRSLMRQSSVMDTPIITDSAGAMKMTFWV